MFQTDSSWVIAFQTRLIVTTCIALFRPSILLVRQGFVPRLLSQVWGESFPSSGEPAQVMADGICPFMCSWGTTVRSEGPCAMSRTAQRASPRSSSGAQDGAPQGCGFLRLPRDLVLSCLILLPCCHRLDSAPKLPRHHSLPLRWMFPASPPLGIAISILLVPVCRCCKAQQLHEMTLCAGPSVFLSFLILHPVCNLQHAQGAVRREQIAAPSAVVCRCSAVIG